MISVVVLPSFDCYNLFWVIVFEFPVGENYRRGDNFYTLDLPSLNRNCFSYVGFLI